MASRVSQRPHPHPYLTSRPAQRVRRVLVAIVPLLLLALPVDDIGSEEVLDTGSEHLAIVQQLLSGWLAEDDGETGLGRHTEHGFLAVAHPSSVSIREEARGATCLWGHSIHVHVDRVQ